jgi:sensor domain CHASE-containing protein
LVSLAIPAAIIAAIYLLSSFTHRFEDWQAVKKTDPVVETSLSVEIDKSDVE